MKWGELRSEPCSVARSLAVIGDRWTLLLLRDCFLGLRRFEAFHARLGISRSLVADRLQVLVDEGVLSREVYQTRPVRHEYRLAPKGLELYPVILSLVRWGNAHYAGEEAAPMLHRHRICDQDFEAVCTCSICGEPVKAGDVEVRGGAGFPEPWKALRAAPNAPAEPG